MRLVKHLLETRVRAKSRTESCQAVFLRSNPPFVPEDELSALEAQDSKASREAREDGHHHVIVARPSKAAKPSILKKPKISKGSNKRTGSKTPACIVTSKPRYRVRCKTSPSSLVMIPKVVS